MPGPSAVLFNHATSTYEDVPAEQVGAAIASGRYTAAGASTSTQAEGGSVVRPVEQMGAAAAQGEMPGGAINAARSAAARRNEQMELDSNKALSFAEGIGDALTVGLLHGTSEESELRREADSGTALLGQLAGLAIGLKIPGAVSSITKGGEAIGGGVARALMGEASTGFRGAVTRGLEEAGANAALMTASAFGHQITDSVIANKPFAAESITSEAGVGAMLGFGAGFLGSSFGQLAKASRSAVEASGIATKESKAALSAVNDLTRAWDDAVEQHAQRVGVLKALADDGHISGDLHAERATALREAQKARDALRKLDDARALGGDPKEYQKWRDAVERYQGAVSKLDEKMTPGVVERAQGAYGSPVKLGESPNSAGPQVHPLDVDAMMADRGFESPLSRELDDAMTPEARARYREIYGRDFEPTPGGRGGVEGEENLGGTKTPTSELGTNPGQRRRPPTPEAPGGPLTSAGERSDTVVDPRMERFQRQPAKFREPRDTVIDAEGDYWDPNTQRFSKTPKKYRAPGDTVIDAEGGYWDPNTGRFHREPAVRKGRSGEVIDVEEAVPTDQTIGREVLKAGDTPASQAETGQQFIDTTKKQMALGPGEAEVAPAGEKVGAGEGKRAVKDYLNNWFREFDSKPRVNVGDQLQARLNEALDSISRSAGSRLDSAGGLDLLRSMKVKEATSPLGTRLDQVWSLGQAGKFAADEARGVKTPLRKGLMGQLQRYAIHRGAKGVVGAVIGGSMGGPMGAMFGMALTSMGFAGAAASTAGKLMEKISAAGEALLKGRRATMAVRAVAGNRPYQYSDEGPIADPVQRILEVQRLAANPDAIRARVTRQLGDLAFTSPELAQSMVECTTNKIQAIAASAPAIMMSPLGRPIKPSGTALNRFLEFESAMHDLPAVLTALGKGSASGAQIKALHVGFPAVHAELARVVLGDPEALDNLDKAKLRTIERALGVPLTAATADPLITHRHQLNWEAPQPVQAPAQSFKITAPKPTPVQSSSGGRAPGNERIAR